MDRKRRILAAVAVLAALLSAGFYGVRRWKAGPGDGTLRLSGVVEATEVTVAFKVPGRVAERKVDEGEPVAAGQLVARLDGSELEREASIREAEVAAAEAGLAELLAGSRRQEVARAKASADRAQARLRELEGGSRPQEVAASEAAVARAHAEAARRGKELARAEALHRREAISRQSLDAARAGSEAASAALEESRQRLLLVREGTRKEVVEQARAAADEAGQQLSLVREGPRREQIALAGARLAQAKAALAVAKSRLADATIVSPLSGVVLSKNVEPGDVVAAGTPVVTVAALDNVWIRAYLEEPELGRVRLGHPVRVASDSWPGRSWEGRVTFVASEAEFTPKSVETRKERVRLVYRIKVGIPNPDRSLKPGMPVDAFLSPAPAGEAPRGSDPRG
jgi:HlyD family secretion protein